MKFDFSQLQDAGMQYMLKKADVKFLAWDIAISLNFLKNLYKTLKDEREIELLKNTISIFSHLYTDFLNQNGEDIFTPDNIK